MIPKDATIDRGVALPNASLSNLYPPEKVYTGKLAYPVNFLPNSKGEIRVFYIFSYRPANMYLNYTYFLVKIYRRGSGYAIS